MEDTLYMEVEEQHIPTEKRSYRSSYQYIWQLQIFPHSSYKKKSKRKKAKLCIFFVFNIIFSFIQKIKAKLCIFVDKLMKWVDKEKKRNGLTKKKKIRLK